MKAQDHQLQVPGLRMTKQRKVVYRALMENSDHPTASQLFEQLQTRRTRRSKASKHRSRTLQILSKLSTARSLS